MDKKQKQECNEDFDPRDIRASYNPAKELGKLGGQKTAKKYGKDYFKELGKKGAMKRWSKCEEGHNCCHNNNFGGELCDDCRKY